MNVNDEIRAVRTRDKVEVNGVILKVNMNTFTIIDSKTKLNELVYMGGAVLVRAQAVRRCKRCGFLRTNEGFEKLSKNKMDDVCKNCRELEVNKITDSRLEVLKSDVKISVQIGKAFVTTDKVNNAVSIVLDYQLAEDIRNEEIARQIAEDFGGRVVKIVSETILKEI